MLNDEGGDDNGEFVRIRLFQVPPWARLTVLTGFISHNASEREMLVRAAGLFVKPRVSSILQP
jgi:hypothetical protein